MTHVTQSVDDVIVAYILSNAVYTPIDRSFARRCVFVITNYTYDHYRVYAAAAAGVSYFERLMISPASVVRLCAAQMRCK